MDLRQSFDEILRDYGHYILMQRSSRYIFCRCWNEKYQEADSRCPICKGKGRVFRIERHQVRKQTASQSDSATMADKQTKLGKMWINAETIYMRHDTHPQVGDLVYEVGWKGHKPMNLVQAYRINDVDPIRGDHGRIEYFIVSVRAETLDKAFQQIIVRHIGSMQNYEFI